MTAASSERTIVSWHAHVYFDPASTRPQADRVRGGIAERFVVQLGRWHEVPIGPHTQAMYQVAFDVEVFAGLVPWLALHREGLSVLVHPNTLAPRADHLIHAIWLGPSLPLRADMLPESIEATEESPVVPNTRGGSRADNARPHDGHGPRQKPA
jgi:aromatic ring-cleaving dioxygenase